MKGVGGDGGPFPAAAEEDEEGKRGLHRNSDASTHHLGLVALHLKAGDLAAELLGHGLENLRRARRGKVRVCV
jgi:hypothetical protein